MWSYPVEFTPDDNDTVMVSFPDVPGAISFGDNEADAIENARDALETVFSGLIGNRQDIPDPSPANGRTTVAPSLLGTLKLTAYRAMRERGWRKADLARALDVDPRQIDRLLDLRHGSTVLQLEQALSVCGKRIEVATRQLESA